MQRLHVGLDRLVGEQRRAVAAAFDEADARHHRIALERVEREHQRLLDHAVDDQPVLGRIDVGHAAMADGEMQAVRRDDALEQVVRRAGARVARLVVGIVDACARRPFRTARRSGRAGSRRRPRGSTARPRSGSAAAPVSDPTAPAPIAPASMTPRPSSARRSSRPLPATGSTADAPVPGLDLRMSSLPATAALGPAATSSPCGLSCCGMLRHSRCRVQNVAAKERRGAVAMRPATRLRPGARAFAPPARRAPA